MQNQIKPPALNDNMSREELAERVAEMMVANNDMNPVDESFLATHNHDSTSRMVG